jgi:hypothetical protein
MLMVAMVLIAVIVGYALVFRAKCLSVVEACRAAKKDMDADRCADSTKLDELHAELEHWKAEAANEVRRRAEVVQTIVTVQKERDTWKDLYLRCATEHGVAQDIMMQEIQHLQRLLKQNGIKGAEGLRSRNVTDEFRANYLEPLKRLGDARGTLTLPLQKQVDLPAETLAVLPRD